MNIHQFMQGYKDAKAIFDTFWDNIYAEHLGIAAPVRNHGASDRKHS